MPSPTQTSVGQCGKETSFHGEVHHDHLFKTIKKIRFVDLPEGAEGIHTPHTSGKLAYNYVWQASILLHLCGGETTLPSCWTTFTKYAFTRPLLPNFKTIEIRIWSCQIFLQKYRSGMHSLLKPNASSGYAFSPMPCSFPLDCI